MRTALLTLVLFFAGLRGAAAQAGGAPNAVQLRPVDRATVRVMTLGGIRPARVQSTKTRVVRLPAVGAVGHGTGFVIDKGGLLVTAAHVVQGADAIAILLPGHTDALAAKVLFVHPERDIAVLRAQGSFSDTLDIPAQDPPLQMSEQVNTSGYPIELQERYPAATSGVVSRQTNDGSLQLAMGVNPGNSGGPVINGAGQLLGLVSRRGEPKAGVENISLIEPVRFVREALGRARTVAEGGFAPAFREQDRAMAALLAEFARTSDEKLSFDPASAGGVERASAAAETPEEAALVAAHAWNLALSLLESRGCVHPGQLGPADRGIAQRLIGLSLGIAQRIDREAPYVRVHYPIIRTLLVSGGRPFLPASPGAQ